MYQHNVQYYETDKMGITHHSNYIRFMEEARLVFFKNIGFDYSTVGDVIDIDVSVKAYNGIVLTMHYVMKVKDTVVLEGDSDHCFLNKDGKMLPLSDNKFPELHHKLKELVTE